MLNPDYAEILSLLQKHCVDFLPVGAATKTEISLHKIGIIVQTGVSCRSLVFYPG